MSSERRLSARRILYSPEYLDMGADNGGVVVNLSEGGLGFHAVGPVVPDLEIPVSFSLGPGYRIDVKARVVWVGDQGKIGGAAFGKLSKDSRSLIREWLAKPEVETETENAILAEDTGSEGRQHLATSASAAAPLPESAIAAEGASANAARQAAPVEPPLTVELETAAGNGAVLRPPSVEAPATPSPARAFPARDIASPSVNNAPIPETAATAPAVQNVPAPSHISGSIQNGEGPAAAARSVAPAAAAPDPEPAREHGAGASFSLVPSISAWNKGTTSASEAKLPQSKSGRAPLFPPGNAENIFARPAAQTHHDSGRRRGSALMVISVIIAAGAIIAFYARGHRQQIGNAIVHVGNSVAGSTAASATEAPPASANKNPAPPTTSTNGADGAASNNPPAVSSQARAAAPSPNMATTSNPTSPAPPATAANTPTPSSLPHTKGTAQKAGAASAGQTSPNGSKPAPATGSPSASAPGPYSGQAEYERAESYLNGKGVDKDTAQAAEWFWRSLEAGNTGAALPLADLYIAGDGVSRSCTQARILLDAAAQKNNQEAIHKLAQLPENCQ